MILSAAARYSSSAERDALADSPPLPPSPSASASLRERQRALPSVRVVDEPPAALAIPELAVPLLVASLARRHVDEAPVTHAVEHRCDHALVALENATIRRLRARRQLLLALGDAFA